MSRQNVRKYAAGEIQTIDTPFAPPFFSGDTSLWHLYDVTNWFLQHTDLRPAAEIVETAWMT